jgi:uncharacterized membrane protein YukC
MGFLILLILLLLIFCILLFIRRDKEQIIESFSLGDFLHQNQYEHTETTIITKINEFFDSDHEGSGDGNDDGDGGE